MRFRVWECVNYGSSLMAAASSEASTGRKTCFWLGPRRGALDSNLQPSGYEHPTLAGKFNENQHFRQRSATFVHVWSRRFIGYLLVEPQSARENVVVRTRLPAWRRSPVRISLRLKFPANREINREYYRIQLFTAILVPSRRVNSMVCRRIPYATEQGIIDRAAGKISRRTGNCCATVR